MADATPSPAPWHAAFPAPKSAPGSIDKSQLLQWLQEGKQGGIDFVLVDLRRNDFEGGTIRGSINLPAQSLYPTMPYLFNIFSAAGVKRIMWYCGSSQGRGSRAAAWFQDYINEEGTRVGLMESVILAGGIKGWIAGGEEYLKFVDGYEQEAWIGKI